VDDVLACGKLGGPCIELKWDVSFEFSDDLRLRFGRVNRQRANQSNERQQLVRFCAFSDCMSVNEFSKHFCFSSDLYLPPLE
jgi:hypothetical protein